MSGEISEDNLEKIANVVAEYWDNAIKDLSYLEGATVSYFKKCYKSMLVSEMVDLELLSQNLKCYIVNELKKMEEQTDKPCLTLYTGYCAEYPLSKIAVQSNVSLSVFPGNIEMKIYPDLVEVFAKPNEESKVLISLNDKE
ncbi:MAG TPA: hypothetical protein DCL21_05120 [Alphaproteobacteria bacterium]|nr:hypothetical protein [Alphaproteobacteria bacterium]